ncbi:hypothetical protein FGB62_108g117 [Gracilaria domingensis]|nr:hypothetical protein FGB62_108g117 [Gracilaria domingensis]
MSGFQNSSKGVVLTCDAVHNLNKRQTEKLCSGYAAQKEKQKGEEVAQRELGDEVIVPRSLIALRPVARYRAAENSNVQNIANQSTYGQDGGSGAAVNTFIEPGTARIWSSKSETVGILKELNALFL